VDSRLDAVVLPVVLPSVHSDSAAERALRTVGVTPLVEIVSRPADYSEVLTRYWKRGSGFVLVEHDIVPWPGALERLADCSKDYCGYYYQLSGRLGGTLGCVKFSERLLQEHPNLFLYWRGTRWDCLDGRVALAMLSLGYEDFHVHQPPVAHLHVY